MLYLSLVTRHLSLFTRQITIILLSTIISFSCTNNNQEFEPDKKFSKDELIKDLKRIKSYALEEHPALLSEIARNNFKQSYDYSLSLINDSLKLLDFYFIARKLVGEINCGHTKLHLPEGYWGKLTDTKKHFPFRIYYTDNKMYIIEDYSGEKLIPAGSEILSINDKNSSEIINNLLKLITSDGLNVTYKYSQMNNIEYGLFPGYPDFPDFYKINYRGSEQENVEYAEIQSKTKSSIMKIRHEKNNRDFSPFKFSYVDSKSTAVLSVKEFIYFPLKEYQEFIRSSFESVNEKRIKNLIIDLRGNDGGDPANAAEILAYITDSKPVYFERWVPGYNWLKKPLQPKEPQFKGKLFVLTDGECFSTTGHLISLIKYHKLATLIGDETGGSYYCYGCQTDITLPNTKIVFSYSRCTFQTKVSGFSNRTGIQPDIRIIPGIDDIISGNDPVKNYVMNFINQTTITK